MTVSRGSGAVVERRVPPLQRLDTKDSAVMTLRHKISAAGQKPDQNRYLVVSPYTEQEHLLDLESLGVENRLLALSLTKMKCLREDYATAPYTETFNWGEIMATLRMLARKMDHVWNETSFFVVAFRSQIPPTTVYAELGTLDRAAHSEATASGGFLKYAAIPNEPISLSTVS